MATALNNGRSAGDAPQQDALIDFDAPSIDLSCYPQVLDDALWNEIATRLHQNDHVTQLNLSNNTISNDMAESLGSLLNVNPHICVLNLVNCGLSDAGATVIVRCARRFKSLQSLNLSKNPNVADAFMAELEKLLQVSSKLVELALMDTKISFAGIVPVVQAMVGNTSLLYCSLPFHLGHAILAEVDKLMHRNWQLQQHVGRAAQTYNAVQELAEREQRLRETKWKIPQVSSSTGPNASHRLRTVEATRSEWTDPSSKVHLLFLTLLDRKSKFSDDAKQEKEKKNQALLDAAIQPQQRSPRSSRHVKPATLPQGGSQRRSASRSPRSVPPFLQLPQLRR